MFLRSVTNSENLAYAEIKRCAHALLIYPTPVHFEEVWGDIHTHSLTFAIAGDLEGAGQAFLAQLLALFPG